jgi:hypothetical protein
MDVDILPIGNLEQGCQMFCFRTKNPNLGKFWRALDWKKWIYVFYGHLENFTDIWDIFMTIWYILYSFGTFFPVLVSWTKKNLATLIWKSTKERTYITPFSQSWAHNFKRF